MKQVEELENSLKLNVSRKEEEFVKERQIVEEQKKKNEMLEI